MVKFSAKFALLLLVGLLLCLPHVSAEASVTVEIGAGKKECFYENAIPGVIYHFSYLVLAGGERDLTSEILGEDGRILYSSEREDEVRVMFKAEKKEFLSFCLKNEMSYLTPKVVSFSIRRQMVMKEGSPGPDYRNDNLIQLISRSQGLIDGIGTIQDYLAIREVRYRSTAESANTRVVIFALLEMVAAGVLTVFSVLYIRKMFALKRAV
ncbi:emp24/gp25L/p24 family/GOLD, putative [Angomonas deanei]|uniref:Emp24/gp25L/p24 family/GOLD, putative n=1 Tax=Angomonas deanei TaxID=59799 RepID=A0A7G2C9H4_9TRYP|nr:emp24/gp25L/p24 family/GOLD, putative [Angomonas deanei]